MSFLRPDSTLAQDQEIRVIELTAKKYEYSPSPFHVKAGTKVQLKITATDHDHGFKIATVPDGSEPNSTPGLVFASLKNVGSSKRERRPWSNSPRKPQALIRSSALTHLWSRSQGHEGPNYCRSGGYLSN